MSIKCNPNSISWDIVDQIENCAKSAAAPRYLQCSNLSTCQVTRLSGVFAGVQRDLGPQTGHLGVSKCTVPKSVGMNALRHLGKFHRRYPCNFHTQIWGFESPLPYGVSVRHSLVIIQFGPMQVCGEFCQYFRENHRRMSYCLFSVQDRPVYEKHDSLIFGCETPYEMEEWIKAINRILYTPNGGGMFGRSLRETVKLDACRGGIFIQKFSCVQAPHKGTQPG